MAIVRYAQITINSKSEISLQYLKKEGRDELDFLHAGKYQIFLQGMISILVANTRHAQSTHNNMFGKSLEYVKEEMRDEVDFLCR